LPAPIVATYTFVNPVVAVILGVVILGEHVTLLSLFGATLVMTSIVVFLYFANEPTRKLPVKAHSI
jgi:drug/metabolite transporter (DMT)-like permease